MKSDDREEQYDTLEVEPALSSLELPEGVKADGEVELKPLVSEYCDEAIKLYLAEIRRNDLLSAAQEKDLALRVSRGDRGARDLMIVSNLRLVVKIAKSYLHRGLPFLDLIEEGNLGLIKAVERFDVSKGCRLSTYATWWIRQCIERALINQVRTIRLPVHVADEITRMFRANWKLERKLNREPSIREVADALDSTVQRVRHLMVVLRKTFSIEQPMGKYADYCLADTIPDTLTVLPSVLVENLNSYQLISNLFETLSEPEKLILKLRFGLYDEVPQTLDTIGRSFGVTRERIRQIEAKALDKLRKMIEATELPGRDGEDNAPGSADGK